MSLEFEYEKLLKIKTSGRDDSNSNSTNYPYEATSYEILRELVSNEYISKDDTIIDFGSGKGRVDFFLAYYTKAIMIGVEYDSRLYKRSLDNLLTGKASSRVSFVNCCASEYAIPNYSTGAYFFNPFSIFILKQVVYNIYSSFKDNKREFKLFFYYPSDEYINVLNNIDFIHHLTNIDCNSLFNKYDKREYIAIYEFII